MKNIGVTLSFCIVTAFAFGQQEEKLIQEKDVVRIIQTLASDDMMGRSATDPVHINKAAGFIEGEFRKIGLTPLKGLSGFLQEFKKERVSSNQVEVTIDGETISPENSILVSEKANLTVHNGWPVKSIVYDATAPNKDQYFFDKAFALARDTASAVILVAPEFANNFKEFKGIYGKRFINNRKGSKIFVLGKTSAGTYSITASQQIETINMANVVGVLEGKTKPEEIVVFSGHYDHIGIQSMRKIDGDSIANGADDDASGTTAVIELARYFKKMNTNNRTLIFVAFTAEEVGGFGARYFSQQLDAEKVVAMFNIEMIGKPSKWGRNFAFITGFERSNFGSILQKNLTGSTFQFKPDPYPEQNLFYRSDNATLARLGVPAHTISTDQIDIDKLYHTVKDEFSSMDTQNITLTIRAIAISSRSIISGADTPSRIDKATVR